MLTIPTTITGLLHQESVPKNFRVIFPNGELPDLTNKDMIRESVRFTESICSREYFRFGLAEASVMEFETVGVPDMRGMTIQAFCEVCTSSLSAADIAAIQAGAWDGTLVLASASDIGYGYFRIPYGTFVVDSCPRNHEAVARRKVKAFSPNYFAAPTPFERTKLRCPIAAEGQVYLPDAGPLILSMLAHDSDAPLIAVGMTRTAQTANISNNYLVTGISVQVQNTDGETLEIHVKNYKQTTTPTYTSPIIGVQYSLANLRAYMADIDEALEALNIDYSAPATIAGAVQVPISSAADVRKLLGRATQVYNGVTYGVTGDSNGLYDYIAPYYRYRHNGGTPVQWVYDYLDYTEGDTQFVTFYPGFFRSADGLSIVGFGDIVFPSTVGIQITNQDTSAVTSKSFELADMPNSGSRAIKCFNYDPPTPAPPLWDLQLRFEANGDVPGESNFVGVYSVAQLVNDYLELLASFASPARAGSTEIFRLSDSSPEDIQPGDYESFWWDEYTGEPIGIIRFSLADGSDTLVIDYTFGTGTAIYDMTGNELLKNSGMTLQQACDFLLQYLAPYLQGLALNTAEADVRGLPYVESGDCLDVTAADGSTFRVYLTRRELRGIRVLSDAMDAVGNQLGGPRASAADVQISPAPGPSTGWTSEVLATNLTIYRQDNMRMLVANGATVANPIYTLAEDDRPGATTSFFGLRGTTSSDRAACFFRVFDTGAITWRTFSGGILASGEGWGQGFWTV